MQSDLSHIEIRLVSSMLSTHTDMEIADVLQKPVTLIREVINILTGGGTLRKVKQTVDREKAERKQVKKHNAKLRTRAKSVNDQDQRIKLNRELLRIQRERREKEQMLPTRNIDYSNYVTIRIDRKTVIQVPAGTNVEKAKEKYIKLRKPEK